ncbi:hypothetical protein CEXT_13241, partial [Caerostris extrusa]
NAFIYILINSNVSESSHVFGQVSTLFWNRSLNATRDLFYRMFSCHFFVGRPKSVTAETRINPLANQDLSPAPDIKVL